MEFFVASIFVTGAQDTVAKAAEDCLHCFSVFIFNRLNIALVSTADLHSQSKQRHPRRIVAHPQLMWF